MKTIKKNIGFIHRNIRKILIYYDLIDEGVYMGRFFSEKFILLSHWFFTILANGILWMTVFLIPVIIFGLAKWIPLMILSLGIFRFLAKEIYEEKIRIEKKGGREKWLR